MKSKHKKKKENPLPISIEPYPIRKEIFDEFFIKKCEEALKIGVVTKKITKPEIIISELKIPKDIVNSKFTNMVYKT